MTFVGDYSFKERIDGKTYILQVSDGLITVMEIDGNKSPSQQVTHSWHGIAELFNSVEVKEI